MIDEALLNKLRDDEIARRMSRGDYEDAIQQINKKCDEIWRWICKESKRKLEWWAFQNDMSYGHGNGSSGGEFDPVNDAAEITIIGENEWCQIPGYLYNDGFPTSFLYEDYKSIVKEHLKDIKKAHKAAQALMKKRRAALEDTHSKLVAGIKAKLSAEELAAIKFKSKNEYLSDMEYVKR